MERTHIYQKTSIIKIILSLFLLSSFILSISSCSYIQKKIDIKGLKDSSKEIMEDFDPGTPGTLSKFIKEISLEKYTKPVDIKKLVKYPLNKWDIKLPDNSKIIKEKIIFPSSIRHRNNKDKSIFYVYRKGDLKGKKVILWVPGMGVSDLAFYFIKNFFIEGLIRNYAVVFYVPPYHMERIESGKKSGEGFFTSDITKNINVILNTVKEIRTVAEYLKDKGVHSIGGWGGSTGASTLLLTSLFVKMDHISIMIPVVDWNSVIINNIHMKKVILNYRKKGFNTALIKKAYGKFLDKL